MQSTAPNALSRRLLHFATICISAYVNKPAVDGRLSRPYKLTLHKLIDRQAFRQTAKGSGSRSFSPLPCELSH